MAKVVVYLRESDERFLTSEGEVPAQWIRTVVNRALEARRGVTYTEHPEQVLGWMLGTSSAERMLEAQTSPPSEESGPSPTSIRSAEGVTLSYSTRDGDMAGTISAPSLEDAILRIRNGAWLITDLGWHVNPEHITALKIKEDA